MKRRSIGERIARAGSLSVRREIAHDWHANWVQDHDAEVRAIERALQRGAIQEAGFSYAEGGIPDDFSPLKVHFQKSRLLQLCVSKTAKFRVTPQRRLRRCSACA